MIGQEAWVRQYGSELIRVWMEARRFYGDDIAQIAACHTLKHRPVDSVAGYFYRIVYRYNRAGYHDGQRLTSTVAHNIAVAKREVRLPTLWMEALGVPGPEARILARELLSLAPPGLVQAAAESIQDGYVGTSATYPRAQVFLDRRKFFARLGLQVRDTAIKSRRPHGDRKESRCDRRCSSS